MMKFLPNHLKSFELGLKDNYLGRNPDNLKYLGEGIKYLPNQLEKLGMNLRYNKLGENP